jgi:hypothetical protein
MHAVLSELDSESVSDETLQDICDALLSARGIAVKNRLTLLAYLIDIAAMECSLGNQAKNPVPIGETFAPTYMQ